MSIATSFTVLGGDRRQTWLVRYLQKQGFHIRTFHVPEFPDTYGSLADCLKDQKYCILPLPSFHDDYLMQEDGDQPIHIETLISTLAPSACLFGARFGQQAIRLEQAGYQTIDYSAMEQMAIANAVPTAEGAIQLLMEALPITLHNARCLLIGYGRIGKLLAHRLKALGSYVTVSARKEADLAMIEAFGYESDYTGLYHRGLEQYDCIINTVPARILSKAQIAQTNSQCLLLELASAPGGFDLSQCKDLGRAAISGAQLPGKVAPATAGQIIAETILSYLDFNH